MTKKYKIIVLLLIAITLCSATTQTNSASNTYQGYIFCASGATAYLLNPSGAQVHTWKAAGSAAAVAYLLPDGSALFPIKTTCTVPGPGAYPSGRLQKIGWDGKVAWDAIVCDATFTPGYDLDPMPNGNVLMPGKSNTGALKLVEFQPSGASTVTVAWQFTLPDSLGKGGYINSLSYNPDLDYILVDVNQVRKLVVIDHKGAGKIVYTYLVGTSGATHAAEWIHKNFMGTNIPMPDADHTAMRLNNLLVVHNSTEAVEVNYSSNTKVKAFTFAFSAHEGSVQRLPNGNTLVCSSGNKATELDDNGKTLRTITLPGSVQRAYMYGPAYPGLKLATGIAAMTSSCAAGKFIYNAAANTGTITVANSVKSSIDIRIYSLNGRLVYSSSSAGGKAVFSTGTLQAGIFFVDVHNASESFRFRIAKMR